MPPNSSTPCCSCTCSARWPPPARRPLRRSARPCAARRGGPASTKPWRWPPSPAASAARELLAGWAAQLGCSATQLAALEASALGRCRPRLEDDTEYRAALALLGVSADSPPATVKRAYRRLLSRHHPDKLAGADAARLAAATDTTRRLHAAWALIRQRQDWH